MGLDSPRRTVSSSSRNYASYLKAALIISLAIGFILALKSALSNPGKCQQVLPVMPGLQRRPHAWGNVVMLHLNHSHLLILSHHTALIHSFLDGAKEHPGSTVPLFVLLNLAAPLVFLPSAPFQLLAGAVWGVPLGVRWATSRGGVGSTARCGMGY